MPSDLTRGDLIRLLQDCYADAGVISLYCASRTLVSARTRAFVDFVVDAFEHERVGTLTAPLLLRVEKRR